MLCKKTPITLYSLEARTRGTHKLIEFRLFKHYSADIFKETPTSIYFPYYQNFNDVTEAYDDFIQKIVVAIGKVKGRRIRKKFPGMV